MTDPIAVAARFLADPSQLEWCTPIAIEIWENRSRAARCSNTDRPLARSLDLSEEGIAMKATRTCSITGCDRPHYCRTWCRRHHDRWTRYGDPNGKPKSRPAVIPRFCTIDGCDRRHRAYGWCTLHYERWKRNGDLIVRPNSAMLRGAANCKWQGENISYRTAHERVIKARGPASTYPCAACGGSAAQWSYDHEDVDERVEPDDPKRRPYSVKIEHYQPLCHRCHWRVDHPTGRRTRS